MRWQLSHVARGMEKLFHTSRSERVLYSRDHPFTSNDAVTALPFGTLQLRLGRATPHRDPIDENAAAKPDPPRCSPRAVEYVTSWQQREREQRY